MVAAAAQLLLAPTSSPNAARCRRGRRGDVPEAERFVTPSSDDALPIGGNGKVKHALLVTCRRCVPTDSDGIERTMHTVR